MARIETQFSVGDTVYWHEHTTDSVGRGQVVGIEISVVSKSGAPDIGYKVKPGAGAELMVPWNRARATPSEAFPELVGCAP